MKRAFLTLVLALCSSCTTPKEIEGQKVIGKKWVDGQLIYIVEGNREVMMKGSAEAKEASKGVVFAPLKQEAESSP